MTHSTDTQSAPQPLKSNPVPVRFDDEQTAFLAGAAARTGFPRSEIVRRAVKLLREKASAEADLAFLLQLT